MISQKVKTHEEGAKSSLLWVDGLERLFEHLLDAVVVDVVHGEGGRRELVQDSSLSRVHVT